MTNATIAYIRSLLMLAVFPSTKVADDWEADDRPPTQWHYYKLSLCLFLPLFPVPLCGNTIEHIKNFLTTATVFAKIFRNFSRRGFRGF